MYAVVREQYRWLKTIGRFKKEVDTERGKAEIHKGFKCKLKFEVIVAQRNKKIQWSNKNSKVKENDRGQ